jgi:hypothetical protein
VHADEALGIGRRSDLLTINRSITGWHERTFYGTWPREQGG